MLLLLPTWLGLNTILCGVPSLEFKEVVADGVAEKNVSASLLRQLNLKGFNILKEKQQLIRYRETKPGHMAV